MKEGNANACSVKGKIIVLSVLAVALCMLFTVSGSAAERSGIEEDEYDFTLVNTSGSTFNSVWLSHAGKLNWTDSDKLKMSKSLKNGEKHAGQTPSKQKRKLHVSTQGALLRYTSRSDERQIRAVAQN